MKAFLLVIACVSVSVALRSAEPSEKIQRDVTYSTNDGVALKLDIFLPAGKQDKPSPAILYVHGGGWRGGSKSMGSWLNPLTRELVDRGYVVVAVDYRLAPEHKWPAFIQDVKCAVRFLRANAKKYNIDPDHIGTWGSSAGGHLVALLGTADASAKLEGAGYTNQPSRVQAVVDFFGPSDLLRLGEAAEHRERARIVFGEGDEVYKAASPITYVSKDDPPFLIIHGDADKLVPLNQSQLLHEKLKSSGVNSELIVVKDAGHGIVAGKFTPSRGEITKGVIEFFDKNLRDSKDKAVSRQPAILSRAEWNAKPPSGELKRHTPKFLTIHHTATKQKPDVSLAEKLLNLQAFSQREDKLANGKIKPPWPDVPYHFYIACDGNIGQGREVEYVGDTNTEYDPTGHLLVTLEGSFGDEEPTGAQMKSLRELVSWLAEKYQIPVEKIATHKDYAKTACPGKNLYEQLPEIRKAVR